MCPRTDSKNESDETRRQQYFLGSGSPCSGYWACVWAQGDAEREFEGREVAAGSSVRCQVGEAVWSWLGRWRLTRTLWDEKGRLAINFRFWAEVV